MTRGRVTRSTKGYVTFNAKFKPSVNQKHEGFCSLCGVPTIFKNEAILLKPDENVPPCPACGIGATPDLIQLFRHRAFINRIKKAIHRATATGKPFRRIKLPGVVILPNGDYFSSRAGMGRHSR